MPNRLAAETSPYLLQHQHNPVDWYPWGEEAFARAREEDRPVLLSVGYSSCHWCHVMERESFEDADTAAMMNRLFVNVKVDREERPDVDSIYMTAVQQMTGRGGWPMTVFLTPAGEPFWGGTYFPPEPRFGMPSFRQVLAAVHQAYAERREDVRRSADELLGVLRAGSEARARPAPVTTALLEHAVRTLQPRFDPEWGGFGGAPKFPQPMVLELLLRHHARTGDDEALRWADVTLRRMAEGGMRDHLGGGFARYSVDERWLVPHFEKMLYDNAQLARAYLHAHQVTGDAAHRAVVEDTLGWALREMRAPEGGFHSALDADSEGEEGRFYLWTPDEVDALLGPEDGPLFRAYFDVTPGGNFEGRSILHTERPLEDVAAERGVAPERLREVVARGRAVLYEARAERDRPARDDKVLTSWNAMMLHALAESARVLDRADHRDAAVACADFLLRALRDADGRLLRTWKDGRARIGAFLEDHALLADALVAVYEATWDPRWIREAVALAEAMLARFWDDAEGVFHDTATDAEALVVRPRDLFDNATPSGNSAAAMALLRLAALTGRARFHDVARRVLEGTAGYAARVPTGFGVLLGAVDFFLAEPREVAFAGTPGEPGTDALVRVAAAAYLPNVVLALRRPGATDDEAGADVLPLLAGRTTVDGRAAAYVCQRFACRLPETEPAALAASLGVAAPA